MNFLFHIIFIATSFIASLTIYFQRNTPLYLRLFPPFLLVTIMVEIIGEYLRAHTGTNVKLYNPFLVFEFVFYFFMLRQIIRNKIIKQIILHLLWLYPLMALFNIYFIQKITIFNSMTYSFGCLLMVAICIYYFFELFQHPYSGSLFREPAFWICSGLLFFYSCSFPIFSLLNFLNNASNIIIRNLGTILNLMNDLLYLSFTIAFLCRIKARKSMS